MAKYVIKGGRKLKGVIRVAGNKNAVLPIMAATLLTDQDCWLENVPRIGDVLTMGKILKDIGAKVEGLGTNKLKINTVRVKKYHLNPELVKQLRASILLMGPLLARFRKVRMRHPGGCIIGRRATGTHFAALQALGVKTITTREDYQADVKKPKAAEIFLDEASVTATENAMMMASLTEGVTTIKNAACEPHVQDLGIFLNKMGARVKGLGTNRLVITGVKKLSGTKHRIVPDYMEAGSFAMMAAVTKSRLTISKIQAEDLKMILLYLGRMGLKYRIEGRNLEVFPSHLKAPAGKIQTRPWPGFPTDLMSPLIVVATQAKGTTLCHEWMYESRMFFVDKLISMGAEIILCDPHRVLVTGPSQLRGKNMETPDIRAGMALVIAALCAQGESTIAKAELIERGHEEIQSRLNSLGAAIKRVG
jgi:UDP-N-acetylglucosamine 1-carboxyvinyltransferase